jgi:ankyrin repeat protein
MPQELSNLASAALTDIVDLYRESLRKRGFSQLHLVPLGFCLTDVVGLLCKEPNTMNVLNADHRTALYWAVRRRDIDTVKVLLSVYRRSLWNRWF